MVTTPKNLEWHKRREVKKGDYGEELVKKFFSDKGYITYSPDNGPHGFDSIFYKDEHYSALEVKTKPMCRKYPETGFSKFLYDRYRKLCEANKMALFVAFVDEDKRAIYGNYLHELCQPRYIDCLGDKGYYPKVVPHTGGGEMTVYFHESSMRHLRDLTDSEVETLKQLTKEN